MVFLKVDNRSKRADTGKPVQWAIAIIWVWVTGALKQGSRVEVMKSCEVYDIFQRDQICNPQIF